MEQLKLDGSSPDDTLNSDGLDLFRFGDEEPVEQQPQSPDNPVQVPGMPEPPQPEVTPEPADNWQIRAAYFQSQFDKMRNEVEPYMPLIQYVQQNPQALEILANSVQPVQGQQPAIAIPEKPQKPSDYNPHDAIHDSDSASFKYRVAMEEFQEKVLEYQLKQEEQTQRTIEQIVQQEQAKRQQVAGLQQAHTLLTTRYAMAPEESRLFINEMSKEDSITMDNLVGYWKYVRSQKNNPQQNQQVQRKPNLQFPLPAAVASGGSNAPQQTDVNSAFNQTFFKKKG